jgi:cobalamin biosynthesis protein CbiD
VFSLFLHRIDWIKPASNADVFQLITSKILIFTVLGYLLIMAAKNYTTHKHNAVVNRHRQNALLTYRALVTAAEDTGTQDIVLAHAASCIFSPQETGFSHGRSDSTTGSKSVLELMTKGASKSGE